MLVSLFPNAQPAAPFVCGNLREVLRDSCAFDVCKAPAGFTCVVFVRTVYAHVFDESSPVVFALLCGSV